MKRNWIIALILVATMSLLVMPGCVLDDKLGVTAQQVQQMRTELDAANAKVSKLLVSSEKNNDVIQKIEKGLDLLPISDDRRATWSSVLAKANKEKVRLEVDLSEATNAAAGWSDLIKSTEFEDEKTFANTLKTMGVTASTVGSTGVAGPYTPLVIAGGSVLTLLAGFLEKERRKEKGSRKEHEVATHKATLAHMESESTIRQIVTAIEKAKDSDGTVKMSDVKMHPTIKTIVDGVRHNL